MSAARADRVEAALRERELDALLVTHLVNVRWLTGFTGTNGVAVVTATSEIVFCPTERFVVKTAASSMPERASVRASQRFNKARALRSSPIPTLISVLRSYNPIKPHRWARIGIGE